MNRQVPLEVQDLTKAFVRRKKVIENRRRRRIKERFGAVEHVSAAVKRHEIYGLVGPNGCGKSTLIRVVATLLLPDEGSSSVFGHDVVRDAQTVRRLINRVSVDAAFFKKLSANENLLFAARLYGLAARAARHRATEILDQMGFDTARMDDSMQELSRGMQQKVAIARGLLTSPILLLLDEPTTGLDPKSKRDVQDFIEKLMAEHDTTIVLCTHDMEEAERLCHRVAVMDQGKMAAEGTPQELREQAGKTSPDIKFEEVFIELTGRSLEQAEIEAEEKRTR